MKLTYFIFVAIFICGCSSIEPAEDDSGILIPLALNDTRDVTIQAMLNNKLSILQGSAGDDHLIGLAPSGEKLYVWFINEGAQTRLKMLTVFDAMGDESQQDLSWKLSREMHRLLSTELIN
ncbi:hypothetical protein [Aliikangiella coralliicola]|uniref:Lipoprotein n=1 Tax=Aliikangiella coralliicola TaxID=2592383 RepID=A0A545UC69_9GAMM|nr:hypothetical protein [Aliikangiella coralliicola]TQV87059.1 hypothetical protein FLL46_14735 [Aliikangiella coralliicola]